MPYDGKSKITVQSTATSSVRAHRRIRGDVYETPLIPSKVVGPQAKANLLFKAENFQLTGSFKFRGASNKMNIMAGGGPLITASSGNHGIAASRAAAKHGLDLTVVLPETVATAKLDKIKSFGVTIKMHGQEPGAAEIHARQLAEETEGLTYASAYNDPDVIAGQGTIGVELLDQCNHIDNIFVAMGGGGLISGIGAVFKSFQPGAKVFGVAAKNTAALAASIAAGKIVETEHLETLADGVAGGVDFDSVTLPLAMAVIDEVVTCTETEITSSLRRLAIEEHQLVEGAAALALAGFEQIASRLEGQTSVVVLCGSNYDNARILPLLKG
ncbi:MAG: pyridoxal-phosphate dependent enzyme [Paracoccaceae bacterium]